MTEPTSDDDDPAGPGLSRILGGVVRIGSAFLLLALSGCGDSQLSNGADTAPGPVTTPSPVLAPTDEVTIELLPPHSDYVNEIELWSSSVDLALTNDKVGHTREIEARQGEEIVFEIRPMLNGSPVAGPWRSGSASRNPDGEIHALVTTYEGSSCLLVAFEDEDAADWVDHPSEPDYSDTVFWLYPTTSPPYDTSQCPDGPVTEETDG